MSSEVTSGYSHERKRSTKKVGRIFVVALAMNQLTLILSLLCLCGLKGRSNTTNAERSRWSERPLRAVRGCKICLTITQTHTDTHRHPAGVYTLSLEREKKD